MTESPNQIAGPNAGGRPQLPIPTPLTARVGQFFRRRTCSMATPQTDRSKLHWLGTPWTFLVVGILTWPLYIAVLALCVRFHLSVWIANIAAVILIFGGFALSACTVLAAWYRTPRQRVVILFGSLAAWFAVGRILYIWFGRLVREVSR